MLTKYLKTNSNKCVAQDHGTPDNAECPDAHEEHVDPTPPAA